MTGNIGEHPFDLLFEVLARSSDEKMMLVGIANVNGGRSGEVLE